MTVVITAHRPKATVAIAALDASHWVAVRMENAPSAQNSIELVHSVLTQRQNQSRLVRSSRGQLDTVVLLHRRKVG